MFYVFKNLMSNSIYCSEHHPNFCETRNVIHHELAKLVTDSKMYFEARNLSENAEYYPDKRIKTEKLLVRYQNYT